MKKEEFLKLGLTEEQAIAAEKASTDELKEFIPKARFNEINEAKKILEGDLAKRDQDLEELKKVDATALQAEITRLQTDNAAAKEKYEAELKQVQINAAVTAALTAAGAKNVKAAKALLDLTGAELDGDKVKGLEEQLKVLQESEESKFMFNVAKETKPNMTGFKPSERKDGVPGEGSKPLTLADALKAHYAADNNE